MKKTKAALRKHYSHDYEWKAETAEQKEFIEFPLRMSKDYRAVVAQQGMADHWFIFLIGKDLSVETLGNFPPLQRYAAFEAAHCVALALEDRA